jgi:hypothetical protein
LDAEGEGGRATVVLMQDVSGGEETYPIRVVNNVDDEGAPGEPPG